MSWLKSEKIEKVFRFFFFFLLILKILESFVLKGHGDAVSYHQVLGRYILEYGFIAAHRDFYLSNMTGLFDYIYTIPQWIFGSYIKAHLISQFLHMACSLLVGIWVFSKVFKEKILFYSAGIFLLSFARSPDFFIYAKNDGALAITFLIGTLLVFKKIGINFTHIKRHLLIGLCLGLLPAIKMSGIIYALVLGITYLLKYFREWKLVTIGTLLSLSIASIIWFRNWHFIGNPLFPAFLDFFPTRATPEMKAFMESFLKNPASFGGILKNYAVAFSPKFIGYLSLPAVIYNYKKGRTELNQLFWLIFGFTSLYCLINPGYPAERFYFGCHFVLIYFLLESSSYVLSEVRISPRWLVLTLILFLADSKIDKMTKRVTIYYKDVYQMGVSKELLNYYAPYTVIWNHVAPNSNVVSDHAPMQYYAPRGTRLYQAGHSYEANFLRKCITPTKEQLAFFDYYIAKVPMGNCHALQENTSDAIIIHHNYALFKTNH
ncbi:MAG: hypothetical protein K9K67_01020 [Bacteriovoracaceae bacterium]|nr:hypothetical protein [Bacteriovoracaceae bacterium]